MALDGGPDTPIDIRGMATLAAGNTSPDVEDALWPSPDLQLSRWSGLYPYQLLVLRASSGTGGTSYAVEPGWQFTLPMPPESLTYTTPFAVSLSVSLGGIVEEHNGAPLRGIALSGTFGVLPLRGAAPQRGSTPLGAAVFAGTLEAARETAAAVQDVATALGSDGPTPNIHPLTDFLFDESEHNPQAALAQTTGYAQARRLQRFLDAYVQIKRTDAGRDLRLAFAHWKEQATYIVTPVSYTAPRSAASPLEYRYELHLQAWRRVELQAGDSGPLPDLPLRSDPSALAQALNALQAARRTLEGVSSIAHAVVGDVDRLVSEPLREAGLAVKDLLGASTTLADLPAALVRQSSESFVAARDAFPNLRARATSPDTSQFAANWDAAATEVADLRGGHRTAAVATHPAIAPLLAPGPNLAQLDLVDVAKLGLPPAVRRAVRAERSRVAALRAGDYAVRRDQVKSAADRLDAALGAGDPTYTEAYAVSVTAVKDQPTQSDWDTLYALNDAVSVLDALAATADPGTSPPELRVQVMGQLARGAGIAFRQPVSKFAVPFPYGATLESLAQRYLGDPDRWLEIATLNGLREPYVDEAGFALPLRANGRGNQVVVTGPEPRLYVGQTVYIESNATTRTARLVAGLRLTADALTVTLDGDADLGRYLLGDRAQIRGFLPDTLNSGSLVYIPSPEQPADDGFVTREIPGVDTFDPLVAAGGVDWLLDESNDLVVGSDADLRFAAGLTNLVQYPRILLAITQGQLLGHPKVGFPLRVGDNLADLSTEEILRAVRAMFSSDPSFGQVTSAQVTRVAGATTIRATIVPRGTSQVIPLAFQVRPERKA